MKHFTIYDKSHGRLRLESFQIRIVIQKLLRIFPHEIAPLYSSRYRLNETTGKWLKPRFTPALHY